uniref:Uncharacterized protein n=1 Tax=Compsopogon caeruleus TaxID=31354 RepID=A0A7S1T653_9RHOD
MGTAVGKRRKWDKEVLLIDTIRHIQRQDEFLAELDEKVERTRREQEEMQSERVELRNDKQFLRKELELVREENTKLRTDIVNLFQSLGDEASLPSKLDLLGKLNRPDITAANLPPSSMRNQKEIGACISQFQEVNGIFETETSTAGEQFLL